MSESTLTVVLWAAAVLVLGWTWLPALISGLGGTRYANGGSEDPTALEPTADESDYAFWHRQIVALGFEPLGTAWMRMTFHGPQWRYEVVVRVFYSRSKECYAFVQRQPRPINVWWLTMFATCWQDGGILLTSNAVDEPPDDGEYVVQGMESTDLTAVGELHLGQTAKLRSAGKRPETDGRLETLLKATERHSGRVARHVGLRMGQTYLASHALVHFFLSVPAAYVFGLGHWGVPLVNLALGTLIVVTEQVAKYRAAAIMRAQIQSRQAALEKPGDDQA